MTTYTVRAELSGRFWALHVAEIDAWTQARHLRELETMARDLIHLATGEAPGSVELDVEIVVPKEAQEHLDRERTLREAATRTAAEASAESRAAAVALRDRGLPFRDIGVLLGVSYQRAHQLAESATAGE
jgi:hypothetical protein